MSKEIKMIFLLVVLRWPVVYMQFSLYDMERKIGNDQLPFDCLYYNVLLATVLSATTDQSNDAGNQDRCRSEIKV
jgi:hypothetical protein